jgi:hypothetical protein
MPKAAGGITLPELISHQYCCHAIGGYLALSLLCRADGTDRKAHRESNSPSIR